MNVDESKCHGGGSANRINTTSKRTAIVLDDAAEEVSKILGPSANVVGNRFLCVPVVSPHESTLIPEPEFHKTCVANDDALKPFQFFNRDRTNVRLGNCASPTRCTDVRRPFTLDREGRLRITEQKKGGRPGNEILSCSTDDFAGAGVESFRDGRSKRRCPPDHRTKAARSWQIVDDLVTWRRRALVKADLLFCIDDCYNSNLSGIGHIELASRKPFVEKPRSPCEGARWSCPHKRGDFTGFYSLEDGRQNTKINALPLQCEHDLTFECVRRTMAWRQQVPGKVRCRVVAFGNGC